MEGVEEEAEEEDECQDQGKDKDQGGTDKVGQWVAHKDKEVCPHRIIPTMLEDEEVMHEAEGFLVHIRHKDKG